MKAVVVYYSLGGHTEYAAQTIARKLGAEIVRLEPKKPYPKSKALRMIIGGFGALRGKEPELKTYRFNKAKYDTAVLATPIWAGRYAPPMKRFLADNDLSGLKAALVACSSSGNAKSCFDLFRTKVQNIVGELSLINPSAKKAVESKNAIDHFCTKLLSAR